MEKIICISDTHIGAKAFSKSVFENMMTYFESELFPYILKHDIKYVIHLGDLVHNRNFMDNYINQEFKRRFFQWFEDNCIKLFCVVGNHDMYFKNTMKYNYHEGNLKEFSTVQIVDRVSMCNYMLPNVRIGFVPWLITDENFKDLPPPSDVDLLIGHFEISNMRMQGNSYSKHGLHYKKFKDYKKVISGHFHATSEKNNFRYIGTQYQIDWGDHGDEKGFWVIDSKLNMEYIPNTTSPKFLMLYYFEGQEEQVELRIGGLTGDLIDVTIDQARDYAKENYMKFIIKKYRNQDLLERYFDAVTKFSLDKVEIINESSIIEDFDFESFEKTVQDDDIGIVDLIETFIGNTHFSSELDQDIILDKIKGFHHEVNEMEM